jgi:hypothetical protein
MAPMDGDASALGVSFQVGRLPGKVGVRDVSDGQPASKRMKGTMGLKTTPKTHADQLHFDRFCYGGY